MPPEPARLRAVVEHLAAIERPSASEGERRAAEWIRDQLTALGAEARIEEEPAHGTYWVPLGLLTGAAGVAGMAAGRGRIGRALAAVAGTAAATGAPALAAGWADGGVHDGSIACLKATWRWSLWPASVK
jgi:acetylornithine deacetylase/succinyl-diaminopimelate desuccinylase-like protein